MAVLRNYQLTDKFTLEASPGERQIRLYEWSRGRRLGSQPDQQPQILPWQSEEEALILSLWDCPGMDVLQVRWEG